jgi:hypothetical protein
MRRVAVLCALFGLLVAGLGCKSTVTGTHDCTYDPSTAQLPALDGKPSVLTVGGPIGGGTVITTPGK